MASKKGFIVVIILIVIGGGAYWWLNGLKTGAEPAEDGHDALTDSEVAEDNEGGGGMAENCGNDLSCGNRFLAACEPAVFTAQGGALTVETTILGRKGALCEIGSSVALSQLAGLADASLDKNGDGKLHMTCSVQSGLDFNALTVYLKGAGLAKCSGELKNFYDTL